jgi:hypothetical protein
MKTSDEIISEVEIKILDLLSKGKHKNLWMYTGIDTDTFKKVKSYFVQKYYSCQITLCPAHNLDIIIEF